MSDDNGNGTRKLSYWTTIGIVFVTWVFSAGANYAWDHSVNEEHDRRLAAIERDEREFIRRPEYDRQQSILESWLERIDAKIDRVLDSR